MQSAIFLYSSKLIITRREDHGWRKFENRVLRMVFVSKREKTIGRLRKPHNEELCDLYSSGNIITFYQIKEYEVGREYER
jgi:hypothetical protein